MPDNDLIPDIFAPLASLFESMDNTWDRTAARYGFQCHGCEDNCCLSLFFHHTHVEKAYLRHGFSRLSLAEQGEILARARTYRGETFSGAGPLVSKKLPCPLLERDRCRLYRFRPMICRMHGLPYELHKPGTAPMTGPGCHAGQFIANNAVPLDRTPFYRQMAEIEMAFRNSQGRFARIRETVAQMLLSSE